MNSSRPSLRLPRVQRFALLLAAFLPTALPGTAAIPSPEKLLPDDTLIMMTVPDCGKMREINKTAPQTLLWDDPAMKPFRDKLTTKLKEELIQPLERDLGVRFADYTSLPQGQMTLALTQNGWQGTDDPLPAVVFLLDVKDKSAQLKDNLSQLRKKWVDSGKTLKTEKIRNIEFWVLTLSTNDVPKTLRKLLPEPDEDEPTEAAGKALKVPLIIGQFESLLIVGSSTKAVEKVAVRLTGGSTPVLGELPEYEANRLALFRDAPVYGWVNARAFIAPLTAKPPADESETPNPFAVFSPDKIIAAIGLNSLKTIAFSAHYSLEGSSVQMFVGAPEAGRRGLFKLLVSEAREAGPPAFVPADAVKFQRWRLDGQKAWATLQSVMNDISPQMLGGLEFFFEQANAAGREKDPDFDLRKNFFGNLGDDLISYEKAARGNSLEELSSPPSLFLVGSPRPEQLASALKGVLALITQGGTPEEREFLGRKISTVTLPALPLPASAAGTPPKKRTLSYTSSGGYVALTTDATLLEEYLRSSEGRQKTLRDTPGFTEAIARAGGTSALFCGYENQVETARVSIELFRHLFGKSGTSGLSGPFAVPFSDSGFKDWVDFSLLPPFEKIAKYFYFAVYTGSVNAEGLTVKMYAPTPPQLRK